MAGGDGGAGYAGAAGGAGGASREMAGGAGGSSKAGRYSVYGGGGGGAADAAGGASGQVGTAGGSAGTSASPNGGGGHGGSGGGGGYSNTGADFPVGTTTGGMGGSCDVIFAIGGGGGGGGGGGYGAIVTGATPGSNIATITGGRGGDGGYVQTAPTAAAAGGSGGSGGAGLQLIASGASATNSGMLKGGAGGTGGDVYAGVGSSAGAGGAGGTAMIASSGTFANTSSMTGGTGGDGGDAYKSNQGSFGGAGGAGGAGLSASSATFANSGSIAGGAGGKGGVGSIYIYSGFGTGGAGGAGIVGASLAVTNSGTISGGAGGAGANFSGGGYTGPSGAAGDAIDFTGGASSLALGVAANGTTTIGTLNGGLGVTGTLTLTTPASATLANVIHDGAGGAGVLVYDSTSTLTLSGASTFSGGTTIRAGTLDLEMADTFDGGVLTKGAAGTGAIRFTATASQPASTVLALGIAAQPGNGGTFGNTLDDFGDAGEALDLAGNAGTVTAVFTPTMTGSRNGTLTVSNGTLTETFRLTNANATLFTTRTDNNGGTIIEAVCFVTGTLIRTTRDGAIVDVPVEALQVGDLAVTVSGEARPIRWLGRRTVRPSGHAVPSDIWPVRVSAGAFGPGLPARDLFLSPGHPVLVASNTEGGHLVPIMCLINGTTIERVPVDEVTYWHVELDAHDILLAEGLPAESYLDWGDRAFFTEGADHALANPDFVVPGLAGRCRPVAVDGPVVEAERDRLDARFAIRLAAACAWPLSGEALGL